MKDRYNNSYCSLNNSLNKNIKYVINIKEDDTLILIVNG